MSGFDLIIIVLYAATGLVTALLLVKFLLEALVGSPKGWRERARLKSLKKNLTNLAARFENGDFNDGKKTLKEMFHFDIIQNDADVIEQVTAYHHSLLQQILSFGKSHTLHVTSFEVLEDLLLSRTGLLRSYHEAEGSRRTLLKKGSKKIPAWALDEYGKRIKELREKLETNRNSVLLQFEKSVTSDSPKATREEIVYH